MSDCIFCKIAAGEMGTEFIYEDDQVVAFRDINPVAPVHILVIPKKHIPSANELTEADNQLIGHIFQVIKKLAQKENLNQGYRIVNNCGREGGQTVHHLHFHLLGGRNLQWPPG
ncbi:histidine triad nucleotide-binding protein [Anoxybacter fermentans]|uniref:Histidine triad nucleotide-binding protein n=1 Tax=Anoxybacter fermentans TaxID=1323375 RepID=A0A3Q9HQI5_9FIRM|nr:histidine triad nucleotide-binding protein [Anoxybacter fermentans]AZR73168.1 histidine triad nucleotide-binding protein [Anoxybacter fermentans]